MKYFKLLILSFALFNGCIETDDSPPIARCDTSIEDIHWNALSLNCNYTIHISNGLTFTKKGVLQIALKQSNNNSILTYSEMIELKPGKNSFIVPVKNCNNAEIEKVCFYN